jgi:hypothetical protein
MRFPLPTETEFTDRYIYKQNSVPPNPHSSEEHSEAADKVVSRPWPLRNDRNRFPRGAQMG